MVPGPSPHHSVASGTPPFRTLAPPCDDLVDLALPVLDHTDDGAGPLDPVDTVVLWPPSYPGGRARPVSPSVKKS